MLQNYKKDFINPRNIKQLEEKVLIKPEFNFQAVERTSFATKFLYLWVNAMLGYYKVFTETKPLREKLAEMRKIVQEKTEELKIKKEALDKVNKRIQELEDM
jgi:dynein heavy chain, axonemal